MNMDYLKAFELLNQDAEKERNKKAEKAVHDNLYNKGYRDGYRNGLAVLDKLRAEIEQNAYPIVHGVNNHEKGMTLYGILQIIDKYKAESEDKMTVQKMKPCPKCKSNNVNVTCWGMWKAWCRECLFEVDSFLEEKDAIEAWNNLEPQESEEV